MIIICEILIYLGFSPYFPTINISLLIHLHHKKSEKLE